MKTGCAAFGFLILLAAGTAMTQTQPPTKAPRPAATPTEEALAGWNDVGRKLIAMAEDWPEEKYDYKPTPEVRSFAQILLHVGGVNYFFTNTAASREVGPAADDPPRQSYKSKAEVVAFLKKSFADGAAAFKEKGEAGMSGTIKHPFGNRLVHLTTLAWEIAEHSAEHYGNLVTYYRLNGLMPPESRRQP